MILDLNVASVQADTALPKLREACPSGTTFMAVAPHVHTAKIESAKKAGFDRVLTRGQFSCVDARSVRQQRVIGHRKTGHRTVDNRVKRLGHKSDLLDVYPIRLVVSYPSLSCPIPF